MAIPSLRAGTSHRAATQKAEAMQIIITGRKVQVPDDVRAAVERKIGALDRFVGDLDRAEVVFREEKNPRIAEREQVEVTLLGHGHRVRASVSGVDQHQAVDLAVGKLGKQLRKLKTRVVRRRRPNLQRDEVHHPLARLDNELVNGAVAPEQAADIDDPEWVPRIVRRKTFELEFMDPAEAVARMQLLDHDFFLFVNVDSDKPSVVYLRSDGDAGLIEIDA
ncbi:ribosome hibernation-promoting factor, HPF/YfiA family [Candidatus Poriferisodalis sp.]|uniref:ribosome hibernation-promoting factor, HPF/YfiA family n=1 Tax=Candidatus Poriferisodalis sp. TaxID=3101277 RepID=UPI003B5BBCB4